MIRIIFQALKQKKYSILAYSTISLLFLVMYVAILPTFSKEQEKFKELIEIYPKEIFQIFNIQRDLLFNINLESFLALEMFSLVWPILAIVFILSLGSSSLAGEIEKKTMDLLLSQPVSRVKLFFSKYLATLAAFLIFLVFSFLLVIPLAELFNVSYRLSHYFTASILLLAFGLCIMGLSFLASSIFSEKGKANMVVGGFLVLMYVINLLATLVEKYKNFKYLSLFYYFDTTKALAENKLDPVSLYVLLGTALATTILAVYWFKKRDVAV